MKTPSKSWVYCDFDGTPLYKIDRFDRPDGGKTFSQRKADGKGGFVGGRGSMKGVIRVLAGWADLAGHDQVVWVEGETCVDALRNIGIAATTTVGGSGGFRAGPVAEGSYVLQLRRAGVSKIVVLPDNDDAGRAYADQVARACHEATLEVSVVELPALPDGGDVVDYLAAHPKDDLTAAVAAAPAYMPTKDRTKSGDTAGKKDAAKAGEGAGGTQTTSLVEAALRAGVELFHDPEGVSYAAVPRSGHRENYQLRSRKFKVWLAYLFYEAEGKAPASTVIADAMRTLDGRAQFDGPEEQVQVRVARHGDAVYLDLADTDWKVVEVTANGWRVISDPPVRFRRPEGMHPLPTPVEGGSLDELSPFLNVASEDDFCLSVSWLIGTLRPRGPYPVSVLSGEQGTAKSTRARVLKTVIDPGKAALQAEPKNEHDLVIAAKNSHICAFDNLSKLTPRLSDALCRLSTGGGFRTRALYTNDEEALFDAQRPLILNGIPDIATRSDLVDRALLSELKPISDDERRDEEEFWAAFDEAHPRILGRAPDRGGHSIRRWPAVQLAKTPRMADFAKFVVAAEPSLPWKSGEFLEAYARNRHGSVESLLDGDPIADFLRSLPLPWAGTASQLLDLLETGIHEDIRRRPDWPAKKPNQLAGCLRRLAPPLRQLGIDIQLTRASGGQKRLITIKAVTKTAHQPSSQSSQSSQGPKNGPHLVDDDPPGTVTTSSGCDDDRAPVTMGTPGTVTKNPNETGRCDDGDDGDDAFAKLDLRDNEEAV